MEISAGGWRQRCETEIASAGGYVVAVTTVVPDRNVTLVSSYLSSLAGATAAPMTSVAGPSVTALVAHHFRRVLLEVAQEHLEAVGHETEIAAGVSPPAGGAGRRARPWPWISRNRGKSRHT